MTQYRKKLLNLMLFGYGGLMVLLVALLTGSMLLESNVLYQNSFLTNAIKILISVVDVFAFAVSSAILIYGIYLVGTRALASVYAAFFCMTIFHYVSILCIGWLVFPGTLPETGADLAIFMLEDVVIFTLLDCLRLFIVGFITAKLLAKLENKRNDYNRKAHVLGDKTLEARSIAFPISGFLKFKNPLLAGGVVMAVTYWLTFYVQYVYYDIMTLIKLDVFYGQSLQIFELLANAVLACIGYTVITFILIKLDEIMPKTDE